MTADPLLAELTERLGSRLEATWVLAELATHDEPERRRLAQALAARRDRGEPLQYLLGHWPFRTVDLLVDARALIPRPETELLVEHALDVLGSRRDPAVVCDLGCGTGAIAISVAVEARGAGLHPSVHATDLSPGALELAQCNAVRCGADDVAFHLGSWYAALPAALVGTIDLVCANPPYVSRAERATLAPELDFEPELALVATDGADATPGLDAVERVIEGAAQWLAPGGVLLVEHGAAQREAALSCARRAGLVDANDLDDLAGLPRLLRARRAP